MEKDGEEGKRMGRDGKGRGGMDRIGNYGEGQNGMGEERSEGREGEMGLSGEKKNKQKANNFYDLFIFKHKRRRVAP